MNPATEEAPTEVESSTAETSADTATTTSNEADSRGQTPSEETLRAILRGEIPADDAADPAKRPESEADAIDRMFDPETGELLEEDLAPEAESADTATTRKAPETPRDDATAAPKNAESDEDDAEDEEKSKPEEKRRIAIKRGRLNDRDFAIVQLADHEKITLTEAERRLYGGPPAETEAKTAETPAEEAKETVESIQGQIAELIKTRKAAEAALDVAQANDLNDQIYELRDRQRELKQQAATKEQTVAETKAAQAAEALDQSIARAVGLYPDTAVEGSELYQAIESERATRQQSDPAFFQNPKWPIILAVEIAAELGIAPRTGAADAKATRPATTIPARKTARPAPPNPAPGNATAATNQTTEAKLQADLKTAQARRDTDGIKRIMREMEALPAKV